MKYIPGVTAQPWINDEPTIDNALIEGAFSSLVETQSETLLCNAMESIKSSSPIDVFYLYNHLDQKIPLDILKQYHNSLASVALNAALNNGKKSDDLDCMTFCGRKFYINGDVLTPHMQTQELTYATIGYIDELFKDGSPINALDMCSGSGVIGLSIASAIKNSSVLLTDISPDALRVAIANAESLNRTLLNNGSRVQIKLSDLFENVPDKYDIITCNPPYLPDEDRVPKEVKQLLLAGAKEVQYYQGTLNNEPSISMLADENGLKFYRLIAEELDKHLKEKSLTVLEFGGKSQQQDVDDIIRRHLHDVDILYLYSAKKNSPRAAFIFRGFTPNEIQEATPKVLKRIPPIKISQRHNITERSIHKLQD